MGRLIDIENIDYVRLEDSLHYLEHHKGDEVECVICAPTVEAIPRADYEARLRSDIVAMLTDIQWEIEVCVDGGEGSPQFEQGVDIARRQIVDIIQQKIDKLKEVEDGNK